MKINYAHWLFLAILLIMSSSAIAQRHTISGFVKEKGSQETLIGVNIYIPGTQTGTVTNAYGFYSITLPAGIYQLKYSFVGYSADTVNIVLDKDMEINIELLSSLTLQGITVFAEAQERISETPQMSVVSVPIKQISEIPAFLGERDVFKVLQLMPGVSKGSEGSSGLYVRGGGPDQNLIILDDAVVYNANHLFGFFSVFNGDALKSVEMTKGGFPARYGGRLSSVIDMNMKDGNKQKFGGEAGIGLISSRLTLEGPILAGKSSFLVSGRRTYLDVLLRPIIAAQSGGDFKAGYYFYDLNAKVNYEISNKDKLYLSGYFGRDKFFFAEDNPLGDNYEAGLFWENATGTFRWNHLFTNKLFANTSVIYSRYQLKTYIQEYFTSTDYFYLDYHSGIEDISFKTDFNYMPSPKHFIRLGAQVTHHSFTPSAIVLEGAQFSDTTITKKYLSFENAIYIEDEISVSAKVKLNAGFRLTHFVNVEKHYFNPEPRLSVSYLIHEGLSVKASYARMNQYIHLLSPTGIGLPTDLWVPSTDRIAPQSSSQVAAGLAQDIPTKGLLVSLEGYYKKSNNIIGYREGASFLLIDDPSGNEAYTWEDNITSGQGWSYGLEFLVQRKVGKLSGWVGYTLSWTQLQFDDLNFGEPFFAKYDRRHDVSVVAIYKIKPDITLSGTWVYGTGNAITLPIGEYYVSPHMPDIYNTGGGQQFQDYFVQDYGEMNSFRMSSYHRMDIGIQFHKERQYFDRTWEISFYNLYNRKNPFFYYIDTDYPSSGNPKRVLKAVSIFPIIPSISYTIRF